MRRYLLPLCLIIFALYGCGYKMAGLEKSERYKYFVEEISNISSDLTVTPIVEQDVKSFFSNYGSLAGDMESANYVLYVNLTELTVKSSITTASRDAVTSEMQVNYYFKVMDKSNKIIYENSISRHQNFTTGRTVTAYSSYMRNNFRDLTNVILTRFKYEFETAN